MMRNQFFTRSRWAAMWAVAILAMPAVFSSCSMVDAPQSAPVPELDVRNYYTAVATTGLHYTYSISAKAPYYPPNGTLGMDMQGVSDTENTMPLYACLWTYENWGTPAMWFYGLTAQQAVNFGVELKPDTYADSWVDLQSPLQDSASWSFTSQGEKIMALITKYGVSAQVNGKNFDDVLMVQYSGDSGTIGTEWFARNTGLIYSNVTRSSGTVESQLQSVVQK